MTYFAIICRKKCETNLEVSEVLITYVTNRGKARLMLHMGAGHSNNCQIILKLFGYDIFCNNLQHKKVETNWEVSEVLIIYVTNRGKARVMALTLKLSIFKNKMTSHPEILIKVHR